MKRRWGPWLKAALSILLLSLVIWKTPVARAVDLIWALKLWAVAVVVVLTVASPSVAAWRWRRVLARAGLDVSWSVLLKDLLVASTYNLLLPTSIGGDVVRALRCSRRIPRKSLAWSSVLFERLLGVFSLGILAIPGMVFAPGLPAWLAWSSVGVMVGVAVAVVLAHAPFRFLARVLAARAPGVSGIGDSVAGDLSGAMSSWSARLETLAWSIVYQFVALSILAVVALSWGRPDWVAAVFATVPLALIVTLLPISIAGFGVRESMFVLLLGQFGISSARALSLAMVWLLSSLLLAVAGALVLLVETRSDAHHVV